MRFSQYFQNLLPLSSLVSGLAMRRDVDPDNPEASNPTTPPKKLNRPPRPANPFTAGLTTAPSSCTNFMKPSAKCVIELQAQPGGVTVFSGGELKWDSDHKCDNKQQAIFQTAAWDAIALAGFADQEPDPHNFRDIAIWKTYIGPDYPTQQKRIAENLKRAGQFYSKKKFDIILTCKDPNNWCKVQKDGKSVGGYAWTYKGWFGTYYYINMCQLFFQTDDLMYKIDQIEEELAKGNTDKARKAEWQKSTGQMFLHEMMHLDSVGQPHINDELIDPDSSSGWAYGPARVHALARRNLNQGGGATRASTNADSYAWLANSKYWYDLTGYFPAPSNYKAADDNISAEDLTGFTLNLGLITDKTSDTEIQTRLNSIISGSGNPPSASAPKPGKSLSIAMVSSVNSHSGGADVSSTWNFYTTTVGKAVGSCGETDGEHLIPENGSTSVNLSPKVDTENPPWPGGTFKLKIEGEACEYKNDGGNPGRLFCPHKQISCTEDGMKSKKEGTLKCGDRIFFHAVVYCDF